MIRVHDVLNLKRQRENVNDTVSARNKGVRLSKVRLDNGGATNCWLMVTFSYVIDVL